MPVSKAAQHQPLSGPGVSYNLRFVGSIDVRISMKTLEFSTRTALVKECICLVCEQAGYISSRSKHHIDGRVKNLLGPKPTVTLAGNNVDLVINTQSLTVLNADEDVGSLIFSHLMPNVSFASGGEEHQGSCEHLFVVSDVRLMNADDCQLTEDYPVQILHKLRKRAYCCACKIYTAKWVSYENDRLPVSPAFFCEECFRKFHYDKEGNKKGHFKAIPYFDRIALS